MWIGQITFGWFLYIRLCAKKVMSSSDKKYSFIGKYLARCCFTRLHFYFTIWGDFECAFDHPNFVGQCNKMSNGMSSKMYFHNFHGTDKRQVSAVFGKIIQNNRINKIYKENFPLSLITDWWVISSTENKHNFGLINLVAYFIVTWWHCRSSWFCTM